jgi:hypothetical protein
MNSSKCHPSGTESNPLKTGIPYCVTKHQMSKLIEVERTKTLHELQALPAKGEAKQNLPHEPKK